MNKSNKFLFPLLFLLGFHLKSFAQKESSEIKKLSKGADVILTGKITQKKSGWNETKTRIYTKATLKVDEYLKGKNNGKYIEITYPGGEVGDIGEIYTHMPKFADNEEVLVFLKKDEKNNGYKVLNGEEGKITVLNDAKTKEKVTSSNLPIKALKAQIKSFINEK
jgi:hypothetical protein